MSFVLFKIFVSIKYSHFCKKSYQIKDLEYSQINCGMDGILRFLILKDEGHSKNHKTSNFSHFQDNGAKPILSQYVVL